MIKVENKGKTEDYVYDISLDGTVVNALGCNIVSNTDGFNFQLPKKFRFTKEHPYVSNGLSRLTEKGKEYIGDDGDIAEFNDKYMIDFHYSPNAVQKMGLDRDERCHSTINFSRKNYADNFPWKPFPDDVKLVGNTVKSKKMPTYIETFLDKAIRLLLKGNGQEFLNEYYSYIEKIYNYQIPLRDIASKGKIKKSLNEYKKDVQVITKAGRPKSRQAWYELALKYNLKVDNGDTIYYINNGSKKSDSDIKKVTKYYQYNESGEKIDITKDIEKAWKVVSKELKKNKDNWIEETFIGSFKTEEIIFNCELLPREIIEKEGDTFCSQVDESLEYNVIKYITQFNNRIKPLLVCFNKKIREQILIENPKDRLYFTEEECILVSGEPNKLSDQDTYEQLMTMEDKEIKFWEKNNLTPPFINECDMGNWEDILKDYHERMRIEAENGVAEEKEIYRELINSLTDTDIRNFLDEGELPNTLLRIVDVDANSTNFISKKYKGVVIGNISDIVELSEKELNAE